MERKIVPITPETEDALEDWVVSSCQVLNLLGFQTRAVVNFESIIKSLQSGLGVTLQFDSREHVDKFLTFCARRLEEVDE